MCASDGRRYWPSVRMSTSTSRRIQDAQSGRHGHGLQARGIRSARSLELPCLGAGAGGGRVKNIDLLRSMLLQRRFEERVAEAYALGRIGGFCHLYIGQEAVSTGTLSVLRPDDYVITTYRDHGQALARGIAPRALMAELFGKA